MIKLLCLLTLFAAIAKPGLFLPWQTEHVFFSIAGTTAVLFAMQRIMSGRPLGRVPQRKYIYLLVIVYALSIAQIGWLGGTLDLLLFWVKIVVLFTLLADTGDSVRDVKRAMAIVVLAVCVLTWLGWDMFLHYPERLRITGRLQSVGDYDLSNSFALALTIGTAYACGLINTGRGIVKKAILAAIVCVFAVSCIYTRSRGGNLGLMVALLASLMFSPVIRSRFLKGVLVVGIVAVALASVPFILNREDASSYFGADGSADDRIDVFWAGVHMIRDHPLLGVGFKQFPDRLAEYGVDKKLIAHNTLLSVTAETGVFGGMLFVLMILATLRSLWSVWRLAADHPEHRELGQVAQGLLIALVAFLVNTSFSVKDTEPLLWATLGIAGSVVVISQRAAKTPASPDAGQPPAVGGGPTGDVDMDERASITGEGA